MSDRVEFTCNGEPAVVSAAVGETLLSVLREQLGVVSVKDGCAPQGQCGCCTVLIDGEPRVACVTPALRAAGRHVTTVDGLDANVRDALVDGFVACGGSQCGFCTPGIVVRVAALAARGEPSRLDIDRALAAHLCRCTGWLPIVDSITRALAPGAPAGTDAPRGAAAAQRAELEGGAAQRVDHDVPLGAAGFADDVAPRDALVAIPKPPGSGATTIEAAGMDWVVAENLESARALAGKVQGRRTTRDDGPPLDPPDPPAGGVALATQWVEPAYLEPDASWCAPGEEPASPLANGGAFGGKLGSLAPEAARELAASTGRTVRVVYSREDTVRLGAKRPPIAAIARYDAGTVEIVGCVVRADADVFAALADLPCAYALTIDSRWESVDAAGPPVSTKLRAFGLAEQAVLVEGALAEAGVDRASLVGDRAGRVLLDCAVEARSGACAGARVHIEPDGLLAGVDVRVAAGDPLDEVVLHSYALGAVHMALGWVLSEGLAVDRETGEMLDLTIRSFGIIRARDLPPVNITIVDDPGPPLAGASDAVFAAVAAAAWNAIAMVEGARPTVFPATATRAARSLRRALSGAAVTQPSPR